MVHIKAPVPTNNILVYGEKQECRGSQSTDSHRNVVKGTSKLHLHFWSGDGWLTSFLYSSRLLSVIDHFCQIWWSALRFTLESLIGFLYVVNEMLKLKRYRAHIPSIVFTLTLSLPHFFLHN